MNQGGLYELYHSDFIFKQGLAYLVPTDWWEHFVFMNKNITQKGKEIVPALDITEQVNTELVVNRNAILEQLERQLPEDRRVFVTNICVCPEPNNLDEWTMITPTAWRLVRPTIDTGLHIMTYYDPKMEYPLCPQKDRLVKLFVIFSSQSCSRAYIGFVFSEYKLHKVIKAFARRLGFSVNANTKFSFPRGGSNSSRLYALINLRNKTADRVPGNFIHVTDLGFEREDIQYEEEYFQETVQEPVLNLEQNLDSSANGRVAKIKKKKTKKIYKPKAKRELKKKQKLKKLKENLPKKRTKQTMLKKQQQKKSSLGRKRGRPRKLVKNSSLTPRQDNISTIIEQVI